VGSWGLSGLDEESLEQGPALAETQFAFLCQQVLLYSFFDQQGFDLFGPSDDLLVTSVPAQGPELKAV
jgi:hypothetical protein